MNSREVLERPEKLSVLKILAAFAELVAHLVNLEQSVTWR